MVKLLKSPLRAMSTNIVLGILFFATILSAKVLPIEQFTKLGDYLDVRISPNGKYLASRILDEDTIYMIVYDIANNKVVGGLRPGKKNHIVDVQWISDEKLVYSFAEKHHSQDIAVSTGELFTMDFDGKNNKMLAGYRASNKKLGTRLSS